MDAKACSVHRLVADVAALADGKVLLVRYKDARKYDGQKGWFLPDDFLNYEEHPRDAAVRILREQAGIAVDAPELRYIESFGGGPSGAWHLIFHHAVAMPSPPLVRPGANVAAAEWFPVGGLPPKKEIAHGGWAADVLAEILRR